MCSEPNRPYLELRALAEDLVAATGAERRSITTALGHWLRSHCAQCGVLLAWSERRERGLIRLCMSCDLADLPPPPELPDDVPF